MSHEQSQMLSALHGFSDYYLLLGIIPVGIVLFLVYRKFGTDSHSIGRESIFEKLEHKVVKISVAAAAGMIVLIGAYVLGLV